MYSVLVDVADGAVVEEAGTVHRVGWPTPQSWYTHSLGRKEAERTAPRPPTRRASSGLPLVVGALLVAASLLGSLFVRARRAPFHR